ncbi:low molecular weight protein-tyrosine-phosphatase [Kitasatospora cystarginea]|uniref:protein-tyrosine-phosphatase n=1 Tax=Kitasatospora cystarginea TaxID=58350 RepID=A0ABN3E5N3_9ACTN
MTDEPAPRRILTVCLGNYCRSPLAAAVLAQQVGGAVEVRSAGLIGKWQDKPAHLGMIAAAAKLGYDLTAHRGTQVTIELLDWADLILAMDSSVLGKLRALGGEQVDAKLRLYLGDEDVPDPIDQPEEVFASCAALIKAGAARYLPL